MNGETQLYNNYATCTNELEGWNTVQYSAACVDDIKLVQIRGGTQHSYATCTNEGWNAVKYFVMQLVQMRSKLYNIHLLCSLCTFQLQATYN